MGGKEKVYSKLPRLSLEKAERSRMVCGGVGKGGDLTGYKEKLYLEGGRISWNSLGTSMEL